MAPSSIKEHSALPRALPAAGIALLAAIPLLGLSDYHLHILITILLWSFIYTGWSIMGRFGLVSLGHGAFLGIGAYTVTMLWNHFGLSPWLGIPIALALAGVVAVIIGYPCFRFRITGHYFALGHARPVRGRPPGDRRPARMDRRLARRHPGKRARRKLLLAGRPAVRRQGGVLSTSCWRSGWSGC